MKRAALLVLTCLLLGSVSFAQQNPGDASASKEDIERYLDAMHSRDMMKNMMGAMTKQLHQMVHEQVKKDPNLPADFEARMNRMSDNMFNNFPIEDILQVMIPVYQKHFTKDDIDGLIAFYSTPIGQKVLRELPGVMTEAMQASMGIIQKLTAKVMQNVQDEIAQVQKESDPSPKKQTQQN